MNSNKTDADSGASLSDAGLESINLTHNEDRVLKHAAELAVGSYTREVYGDRIELLGVESNLWAFEMVAKMRSNEPAKGRAESASSD